MLRQPRLISLCSLAIVSSTLLGACISTQTAPDPTRQADVPYGPKIYLKDKTRGHTPNTCRFLGTITGTGAATKVGGDMLPTESEPVNCYVKVVPGSLKADVIETTNSLFQLCVDSGVCKKPDPSSVEKAPVCQDEGKFDSCPVLSVQQTEAARFCQFIGRRLPSGIEHLIMRLSNNPQTVADVRKYAVEDQSDPASCSKAVLQGCSKPAPANPSDTTNTGGTIADKTRQGIFDLTGNISEWGADLIPVRPSSPAWANLPWFCERPLNSTGTITATTTCPADEVCVFGSVRVKTGTTTATVRDDNLPVCIASSTLVITSGSIGAVFGGNYSNSMPVPDEAGIFARKEVPTPDADPADATQGIRCVGLAGSGKDVVVPVKGP